MHLDGRRVNSCLLFAVMVERKKILTVEGLANGDTLHPRDPRTGRVVNRSLQDYHVAVNADVPDIEVIMVDEDDPYVNEIGAKGIGEIGITGIGAAIANAVYHATGKRIRDLPITPDKLL